MLRPNESNILKLGFTKTGKNTFRKVLTIYDPILEGEIDETIIIYKDKKHWYYSINTNLSGQINNLETLLNLYPDLKYNPNLGFVYLIKSQYGYKIGKSKEFHNRMKVFNVKLPFKWSIENWFISEKYSWWETNLHKHFKNKNLNGEWFNLDDNDLKFFDMVKNKQTYFKTF